MGKLYIADKPVLGFRHLYLIYDPQGDFDPNNSATWGNDLIIRGGPQGVPEFSPILIENGELIDESADKLDSDHPVADRNYTLLSDDASSLWSTLSLYVSTLGENIGFDVITDITYRALLVNSNSVINTVLNIAGIDLRDVMPQDAAHYPSHLSLLDGYGNSTYTAYIHNNQITSFYKRDGDDTISLQYDALNQSHAKLSMHNTNDSLGLTTILLSGLNHDDVIVGTGLSASDAVITKNGNVIVEIKDFFKDRDVDLSEGAETTAFDFEDYYMRLGNDNANTFSAGLITKNVLFDGGRGDDLLTGGSGADRLYGGDGNDEVLGGLGEDTLYAGRGRDIYDGGDQTDTLVVSLDGVRSHEKGIQVGGLSSPSSELDYAKNIEIFDIQVGGTYFKIEGLGNTYHLSSSATGSTVFNYSSYINGLDFDLADMTVTDVSISTSDIIAEKLTGSTFREAPITLIGTNKGDNYTLGALPYHNNDYIIYSGTEDDVFNDASGHVYYTGGNDSFFNYQGLTIYMPDDVEGGDISFTIGTSRLEGGNYIADVIATVAGHQTIILKDHITYSDQGGGYYWIISSKISPQFGVGVNPNFVMGGVNYIVGNYTTSFDRSLTIAPNQTLTTDYHDFEGLNYFDASSSFWSVDYYGYEGNDVVLAGNIGRDIYGGSGDDKIVFSGSLPQYKFNLNSSLYFQIESDLFTRGSVKAFGVENFEFDDKNVTSDILFASAQVAEVHTVLGGVHHVIREGSSAEELIYGKNEASWVDQINGGGGNDFLFGYDGDDLINGGTGADQMWGGDGADTFIVTELGAIGEFDTIKDFSTLDGDRIDISTLLTNFDHTQSLLSDFVTIQNVGADTIVSVDTDGVGSLHVSKQILLIEGVTLSTSALTLLYNGTILIPNMQEGISYVYGTYLNDVSLNGSVNDDFIYALTGNDTISGLDGNDIIYGGDGDDDLYGGNGADVLIGGAGEDEYWGGSSADKFVFTQDELLSSSYDRIWDYNPVAGDKIDISALWSAYNANNGILENFIQLTNSGGNTYLNFDYDGTGTAYSMTNVVAVMGVTAGTSAIGLINAGYITVANSHFGTNSNDTISGTNNNDIVFGRDGADQIAVGNGHDVVYGGVGNDIIEGNAGNDLLSGEQGNDMLWGGEGNDILYGLENSDRFFFNPTLANQGIDTIADFNGLHYDWVDIVIPEFDPLTDAITDFVEITTSGSDSILKVDLDGSADSFVQIAILKGITGITDEQSLYDNGYLSVS